MDIMPKKIYYHDTDSGGVVYYANYLKYFEEGRSEYLNKRGIDLRELTKQGFFFVVKGVEIAYKSTARYADELAIESEITKTRNASLEFSQQAKKGDTVCVAAKTTLAFVSTAFKPAAMPQELIERLR